MYNFYIYKVTDKETRQFYMGSQCGGKTIGVNYFTSSRNKEFRNKFKANPAQFEIKIIGVFADAEACILQENIFIKDNIKNSLCLNKSWHIGKNHQFSAVGLKPRMGKHHSLETKKRLSYIAKHRTAETRKRINDSHKGQKAWNKGKPFSIESRKKMSKSHIGQIPGNKKSIICIETGIMYNSIKEASDKYKLDKSSIVKCLKGKRNLCGGFHWKYV